MEAEKTIELIDQETKETYTYRLEDQETESETYPLIIFIRGMFRAFRFGLYLCVTGVELLIKLLKATLLRGYEPFKPIQKTKIGLLDRVAKNNINKEKIKMASDYLARHEYNFERSEQYLAQYKYLQEKLKAIADNKIVLDTEIYRDIFKRINILVVEAENKALQEGYRHAKRTHYKLQDQDIYQDFIKDMVLRGEGETDWHDLRLRYEMDEDEKKDRRRKR